MKILLIDEQDCFEMIKNEINTQIDIDLLEPEYYIAPNPLFFDKMIERAINCEIVVLHRKIWVDECDPKDDCFRLDEFVETIKPIPVLRVGNNKTNHTSCPKELKDVYLQLNKAYNNLGTFIGRKVKPVNEAWHTDYLVIKELEIIGNNKVGCSLLIPETNEITKYFLLSELQPA